MKTKTPTCCNKATFASEDEVRRYWDRMASLGLSRVLPVDVEACMRGWHLVFPPAERETKPRKPLKRSQAKKPARPQGVPAGVKRILLARSGGVCEIGLACGGTGAAQDSAHREGKKAGGTRKPWSNSPATLLAGCRRCHRLIDAVEVRGAEFLGLKVREGVARPWEVPVKHARLGWVLLDDEGGFRPAPAGSHQDGKRPIPVVAAAGLGEAVARYGHASCPPGGAQAGPYVCGCGDVPFWLEVAS